MSAELNIFEKALNESTISEFEYKKEIHKKFKQ